VNDERSCRRAIFTVGLNSDNDAALPCCITSPQLYDTVFWLIPAVYGSDYGDATGAK